MATKTSNILVRIGPNIKTQDEFDSMMQAGYDDALADNSEDANIVFSRIRKRISEHG